MSNQRLLIKRCDVSIFMEIKKKQAQQFWVKIRILFKLAAPENKDGPNYQMVYFLKVHGN